MRYTAAEKRAITRALNIINEAAPEDGPAFTSPGHARKVMALTLADAGPEREHFAVAFLNAQHNAIAVEVMFHGTLDGAAVYPREIARRALELNAAAVVLAHNHPSGCTTPSTADRRITDRIRDGLALLDIRVLDHLILGRGWFSFAEQGLI